MFKHATVFICVVMLAGNAAAQSTAKRGAAAVGSSLSEWADRQAALNAEIELAKAKAEIELDKQRRLQAMQRQQQAEQRAAQAPKPQRPPAVTPEQEEAKINSRHPQWAFILSSSAFGTWLGTRSLAYQEVCKSTQSADIASSCIDDFFKAKILQAQ